MITQILTSKQSIAARKGLGQLSLRAVATDAGIDRTLLGLFERQLAMPADDFLIALRDFYVAKGASGFAAGPVGLEDPADPSEVLVPLLSSENDADALDDPDDNLDNDPFPDLLVRDGFMYPRGADIEDVDAALDEVAAIDAEILILLAKPVDLHGVPFFDEPTVHSDEDHRRLVLLMARAYCLVRTVQGRQSVSPCPAVSAALQPGGETADQAGWLSQVFGELFGFEAAADDVVAVNDPDADESDESPDESKGFLSNFL